ncbi:hypothetical protein KBT16_09720 [Nostoc sp. CCCryo 231-06]|nr:hypothetical protein [Nostoc sp. CCCryo 231-06]
MALASVHRLDQKTSGILLLARDRQTHRQISQQFQQRHVKLLRFEHPQSEKTLHLQSITLC